MNLKLKRTPGIYLIGFMGAGKTTIGRMLAERIEWNFVDLDAEIEQHERAAISELFERFGESEFRRIESEVLRQRIRKVQTGVPMVVALGGGAFTTDANAELLQNNGVTIWLDVAFTVVQQRVEGCSRRPLAQDPESFRRLYESRRAFYERADYRIRISENDSRAALREILKLPLFE